MASERVVRTSAPHPSLSVRAGRGRQLLLVVGAAVFVAAGAWMITDGGLVTTLGGVAAVVFFGLCLLLGIRQMLQSRPALVVDHHGITDRSSAVPAGYLAWTEITGFGIWASNGQKIVTIGVADPEAVLARAKPIVRLVMRVNRRLSGSPVNIAVTALPFTAEELIAELSAFAPPTVPGGADRAR